MSSTATPPKQDNGMPNTDLLFGRYQKNEDWQQNLAMKAAHKALNIPEDMNVNATTTTNNHYYGDPATQTTPKPVVQKPIVPKHTDLVKGILLGGALLLGGIGAGVGIPKLLAPAVKDSIIPAPTPVITTPPVAKDQAFQATHWLKMLDGIWKKGDVNPATKLPDGTWIETNKQGQKVPVK